MADLKKVFATRKILLLDGAMGTQLIARGMKPGECPELWNMKRKNEVKSIAASYFEAGSDAVLTNTFGGSAFKLKDYGLDDKVYEINFAGAEIALEARPQGRFVIGSVGPSGAMPEPFGDVSEAQLTESFSFQIKALVDAGVDGLMLETFHDITELLCALNAAKSLTDMPLIVSMTFNKLTEGYFTIMGTALSEAFAVFAENGVFAFGSNCGNGIDNIIDIGRKLRLLSPDMNILLKPNAGIPVLKDGNAFYNESPSFFSDRAPELLSLGNALIGGCCGTTPDHIRALRNTIDRYRIN